MAGTRDYDAFGLKHWGSGSGARLGFAGGHGYQEDPESRLKLLGHRMYDPSTGRFLTRDPIKDGRNWYGYCDNNPVGGVDPDGQVPQWLANAWDGFTDWWSGRDGTDPNGNPVRIGGWPAVFNPDGNAMTVGGTIHLNDEDDYERYKEDPHWQDHEEAHIPQNESMPTPVFLYAYAVAAIDGAIEETASGGSSKGGPPGHDSNPFEREAEAYADLKEAMGG